MPSTYFFCFYKFSQYKVLKLKLQVSLTRTSYVQYAYYNAHKRMGITKTVDVLYVFLVHLFTYLRSPFTMFLLPCYSPSCTFMTRKNLNKYREGQEKSWCSLNLPTSSSSSSSPGYYDTPKIHHMKYPSPLKNLVFSCTSKCWKSVKKGARIKCARCLRLS